MHLSKKSHPLKLFFDKLYLESVAIDILGPVLRMKRGYGFILLISDPFNKFTQTVPLRCITVHDVSVAFTDHWAFKYGPSDTILSGTGPQFVAHFYQRIF